MDAEGARGVRPAAPARAQLRRLDVFHPARRAGRSGARLSGDADRARTMSAARSASAPTPAGATRSSPNGGAASSELARCPNVSRQARRARHAAVRLRRARRRAAAELRAARRGVAALYRDLHRRVRPERAMFESNFPVDKGSGSYAVFWNAFKRIAAGCSAAEKEALFSGAASRFYRLRPDRRAKFIPVILPQQFFPGDSHRDAVPYSVRRARECRRC